MVLCPGAGRTSPPSCQDRGDGISDERLDRKQTAEGVASFSFEMIILIHGVEFVLCE
jgi:hypothetical protein